jgi:hypothetical protein
VSTTTADLGYTATPTTPTPKSRSVSRAITSPLPTLELSVAPQPPSALPKQAEAQNLEHSKDTLLRTTALPTVEKSANLSDDLGASIQSSQSTSVIAPAIADRAPSSNMLSAKISSPSQINGLGGTNGVLSPPDSPKAAFRSKGRLPSFTSSRAPSGNFSAFKSFNKRASGTNNYKIGFVSESASSLKKRSIAELGAGVYQGVSDVSYVKFLEWIRSERLTTLPHKGSRWDKVLIRALYFAEQLHKFDQAIQAFAHDSGSAAAIGYGHAQLLLEVCTPGTV